MGMVIFCPDRTEGADRTCADQGVSSVSRSKSYVRNTFDHAAADQNLWRRIEENSLTLNCPGLRHVNPGDTISTFPLSLLHLP